MHAQIISIFNSSRLRTEFKGHTLQNVSLSLFMHIISYHAYLLSPSISVYLCLSLSLFRALFRIVSEGALDGPGAWPSVCREVCPKAQTAACE